MKYESSAQKSVGSIYLAVLNVLLFSRHSRCAFTREWVSPSQTKEQEKSDQPFVKFVILSGLKSVNGVIETLPECALVSIYLSLL